ncbi:MAG: citrate/2-methylcitrate synthase [Hyphomicrobiaceae bacterium]|nr:citrate/2-methylcitrate synthase [Hyphomicrobiaceae bacterium]
MPTRDMASWETAISKVVSEGDTEEIVVRGRRMSELIGKLSFAEMMFLMLQGHLPTPAQARTLDALLVASIEHGIAPPSMIARCYASYGTSIQTAIGAGVNAFGDRMGGLGEQMARLLVERLGPHLGAVVPDDALLARIAGEIVADAKRAGARVPGYGIPLHAMDPRAPKVLEVAQREGTYGAYCRLGAAIETALAAARGGKAVPMNVDGVSAVVALDLGFDWRATRVFLITPRTVSFAAHYLEEQDQDTTWRHLPADVITYVGDEPAA